MADTSDPRTIRTKMRLRQELMAACEQHPLEQVSVAEVVRRAGIGRATFYLHYDSLDALALDACAEMVRSAVDALHAVKVMPDDHPPPPVTALFTEIGRRASLYRSLTRSGGGGPLGEQLHRELAKQVAAERRDRGLAGPGEDVAATAIAATFTAVLTDWLHGGVSGTPTEVAARVWRLLRALQTATCDATPQADPR
ncbi:MAG: TetR/AcrR family transcriptional regulator [Actinocatenispora sp.]